MKNWYDILKGTIESYHPWKNEQILRCGSGNMPDFVKLTEWSKKNFFSTFFEKIFFSIQNRSIRVKNMSSRFSIFFPQ